MKFTIRKYESFSYVQYYYISNDVFDMGRREKLIHIEKLKYSNELNILTSLLESSDYDNLLIALQIIENKK